MHTILRATSRTLADFLLRGLTDDVELGPFFDPAGAPTMQVSLNTPQEMAAAPMDGLSVWLYRFMRDEQRVNAPPERIAPNRVRPTPLPLRLYYLITPMVAINQQFPGTSPELEQTILGKALQLLYTHPIMRGSDLRDTLQGTDAQVTARLETLTLEEITRVWHALGRPYQLSASYEVTVAPIYPAVEPFVITPVRVAIPEYALTVGEPEA